MFTFFLKTTKLNHYRNNINKTSSKEFSNTKTLPRFWDLIKNKITTSNPGIDLDLFHNCLNSMLKCSEFSEKISYLDLKDCLEKSELAINVFPQYPEIWHLSAQVILQIERREFFFHKDQHELALTRVNKALSINPGYGEAIILREYLLITLGVFNNILSESIMKSPHPEKDLHDNLSRILNLSEIRYRWPNKEWFNQCANFLINFATPEDSKRTFWYTATLRLFLEYAVNHLYDTRQFSQLINKLAQATEKNDKYIKKCLPMIKERETNHHDAKREEEFYREHGLDRPSYELRSY